MAMTDLKDALTVKLAERISSPFISTFILSWCITNYDIFLLIFSGVDWGTKIHYIDSIYKSGYEIWLQKIAIPFGATLFYIFIWPTIDFRIYRYTKRRSNKIKQERIDIDQETPLSESDRLKFYQKSREIERKHQQELTVRDTEVEELKGDLGELNGKIVELRKELASVEDVSKENQLFKTELDSLKSELSSTFNDLKDALETNSNLEGEISEHKDKSKEENSRLRDELNSVSSALEIERQAHSELREQVQSGELADEALKNEVKELHRKLNEIELHKKLASNEVKRNEVIKLINQGKLSIPESFYVKYLDRSNMKPSIPVIRKIEKEKISGEQTMLLLEAAFFSGIFEKNSNQIGMNDKEPIPLLKPDCFNTLAVNNGGNHVIWRTISSMDMQNPYNALASWLEDCLKHRRKVGYGGRPINRSNNGKK